MCWFGFFLSSSWICIMVVGRWLCCVLMGFLVKLWVRWWCVCSWWVVVVRFVSWCCFVMVKVVWVLRWMLRVLLCMWSVLCLLRWWGCGLGYVCCVCVVRCCLVFGLRLLFSCCVWCLRFVLLFCFLMRVVGFVGVFWSCICCFCRSLVGGGF